MPAAPNIPSLTFQNADNSRVDPVFTTNQSGGTNNIQAYISKSLLPWTGGDAQTSSLVAVLVLVLGVAAVAWFVLRRK